MKKTFTTTTPPEFGALIAELRGLIQSARHTAVTRVNTLQVLTNFEIGRRIVEHEQQGEKRAGYGKELLKMLSTRRTEEFGNGFSKSNLEFMRRFYLEWRHRDPRIAQKPSGQSQERDNRQKPLGVTATVQTSLLSSEKSPFALSWSHHVLFLTIKNPDERRFYEIEAAQAGWSQPEFKR